MKTPRYLPTLLKLTLLAISLLLSACNSSSNDATYQYEITIKNVTANQLLSPPVIFTHDADYKIWQVGKTASTAIEYLAEDGSNSQLIEEVQATSSYIDHVSASGAIASGMSETITLEVKDTGSVRLSIASMLVNTNDAFMGLMNISVDDLKKGDTKMLNASAWDAGTEQNTEAADTIPGPADGGEGFNSRREGDVNFISAHKGVLSFDEGLMDSILDESHRFDNPVVQIIVKRID